MTLILVQYNNYYNRIIKKLSTIEEYLALEHSRVFTNINFIPNDDITTEQIINWDQEWKPDYCIVVDEYNEIVSRWFITESTRTRLKQFKIALKRDVIADYYEQVIKAPVYIQKANLKKGNPLIFNPEGLAVNQIKKSEQLIYDYSHTAWIVGYVAPNAKLCPEGTTGTIASEYTYSGAIENTESTTEDCPDWLAPYVVANETIPYKGRPTDWSLVSKIRHSGKDIRILVSSNNTFKWLTSAGKTNTGVWQDPENIINVEDLYSTLVFNNPNGNLDYKDFAKKFSELISNKKDIITGALCTYFSLPTDDTLFDNIWSYRNKIVKLNGVDYKLTISKYNKTKYHYDYCTSTTSLTTADKTTTDVMKDFKIWLEDNGYTVQLESAVPVGDGRKFYSGCCYQDELYVLAEPVNPWSVSIPSSTRLHNTKEAFDMFCIPVNLTSDYLNNLLIYKNQSYQFFTKPELSLSVARKLVAEWGSNVYDIQILPYCPMQNLKINTIYDGTVIDGYQLDITDLSTSMYSIVKDGNNIQIGIVLWSNTNKGTFNTKVVLDKSVYSSNEDFEAKLRNECDNYRLCSPNYAGVFEFSAVKNNSIGDTLYINVDFTYKPHNPYIHVNPDFGGLYGEDYNDARGLICGGDWSLSSNSNAFAQYAINNRNYQVIFDREVQNLEVNRKEQRKAEGWGVAGGAFQSAANGALTGAIAGGGYGAIAGAAIGGITSAAAGIADTVANERIYRENLDLKKDMFNYSLQNIKALPYGIARTTALTENNKIWPFLEYYTCTDEEKEALINKITYNGMTVNVIGNIKDYITDEKQFIQGQLIRLEDIGEDNHLVLDIANELAKGVYL